MKKVDGYRLLNKPDHAVLLFPLTVIIFVLLGACFLSHIFIIVLEVITVK